MEPSGMSKTSKNNQMGDFQIIFKIMVETQDVLAFLKVSSSTSPSPKLIFKAYFLKRTIKLKS